MFAGLIMSYLHQKFLSSLWKTTHRWLRSWRCVLLWQVVFDRELLMLKYLFPNPFYEKVGHNHCGHYDIHYTYFLGWCKPSNSPKDKTDNTHNYNSDTNISNGLFHISSLQSMLLLSRSVNSQFNCALIRLNFYCKYRFTE